jgi:hypothetical protein
MNKPSVVMYLNKPSVVSYASTANKEEEEEESYSIVYLSGSPTILMGDFLHLAPLRDSYIDNDKLNSFIDHTGPLQGWKEKERKRE